MDLVSAATIETLLGLVGWCQLLSTAKSVQVSAYKPNDLVMYTIHVFDRQEIGQHAALFTGLLPQTGSDPIRPAIASCCH